MQKEIEIFKTVVESGYKSFCDWAKEGGIHIFIH